MNPEYLINATKQVLSKRIYLVSFIILSLFILSVFILIPTLLIPANSLFFQLSIFTIKDYAVLIVLSVLISLLIVMQVFSYKQTKLYSSGKTVLGGGSAITAALFGTASCSACLAAVFGFLGIGTVLFLTKYQWYIVGIAVTLILISLYLTSLKLNKVCETCKI